MENKTGINGNTAKRKPAKKRSFPADFAAFLIAFLIFKIVSRETLEHNLKIR